MSLKLQVTFGILAGWILSISFYILGYIAVSRSLISTPVSAFALAAMISVLPLILGIGMAAISRHAGAHIDGSVPDVGSNLDTILRFNKNTVEQLVLFLVAALGITVFDPWLASRILLVAGLWFLFARLLFLVGYLVKPELRATGFAATFHPTLGLLAWAFWAAVS